MEDILDGAQPTRSLKTMCRERDRIKYMLWVKMGPDISANMMSNISNVNSDDLVCADVLNMSLKRLCRRN